MKRLLVLLGLLGAGAIATRRLLRAGEGTITRAAQRSADAVRRVGPGAVDGVARGVERAGEALEDRVRRIRQRGSQPEESSETEIEQAASEEPQPETDAEEDTGEEPEPEPDVPEPER